MKIFGICLLVLSCIVATSLSAQEQSQNFQKAADDALVQLWNANAGHNDGPRIEGDKLIISSDPDSKTCLYLRVYRVKREGKKSDVTVPSGYTTCVSVDRFEKKSAVSPKLRLIPQE